MPTQPATQALPPRGSLLTDPRVRGYVWQGALLVIFAFLVVAAARNAAVNMQARGIPMSFEFWNKPAGFDVNQKLINFSPLESYGRAFWVGLINTVVVGVIGIVLSTILGFAVGVARLSPNFIVAKLAMIYVELMRNTPLLLQLLFWYNAVLKPLPNPRQSIELPLGGGLAVFLNNRGLILPNPIFGDGSGFVGLALLAGVVASGAYWFFARARQRETGTQSPVRLVSAALILLTPLAIWFLAGRPISFEAAQLKGFNFVGGLQLFPEFAALLIGLVTYTAGFIAEIVRAGIQSVSRGQSEAANALGLRAETTLELVVIPQAMRVIIPPLTSQYLNLVKNSSLAVFIGYPDLVQIFAGTVLNQTGAAVQVMAITMAVYLTISLATSAVMNIYNSRMALRER